MAKLKKKEKLFEKSYRVEKGYLYITDTERSKKKFLKSGIKNVVFGEEFSDEELFCEKLCEAHAYDREFCLSYSDKMVKEVIDRLKINTPMSEIAVFSENGEQQAGYLSMYTRLVTLVCQEGEGYFEKGVPVRRVKKLKSTPDMIIYDMDAPHIFDVPAIDLREFPQRGNKTLTWDRMSFKTDLFDFEINTPALLYFLKKGAIKDFELTHLAKKCRRIFTFS